MSLGNGNPKEGDKGSNFNYELKVLQGLEAIAVALENQTAPEVFTSSTGAVNGAGIIKSSTLLIPANTISTPGGVIEFIAKFYRISGTTNTISSLMMLMRLGNSSKLVFRINAPIFNKYCSGLVSK